MKIKTSELKEVRPVKEGAAEKSEGVRKVNRLEIPKGVSDRAEERERQTSWKRAGSDQRKGIYKWDIIKWTVFSKDKVMDTIEVVRKSV